MVQAYNTLPTGQAYNTLLLGRDKPPVPLRCCMDEESRVQEHNRRWPVPLQWQPRTPGWQKRMSTRERQLRKISDMQQRWDGFTDLMQSGALVQNFTRDGFEIVRTPIEVQARLHASLQNGLRDAPPEGLDSGTARMISPEPRFIHQPLLNHELIKMLQPMHEVTR